jgi:hypothetical protein
MKMSDTIKQLYEIKNNIKDSKYVNANDMRSLVDWCISSVEMMEDAVNNSFELYNAEPSKYLS